MDFNPKQNAGGKLFARGEYEFIVVAAEERVSSNGNLMIELNLKVSNGRGETRVVKDYLLAKRRQKLQRAAVACGLGDKYETGSLSDHDFLNRRGLLKLSVEKDDGGEYPDRNVVADYLPKAPVKALPATVDDVVKKYTGRAE